MIFSRAIATASACGCSGLTVQITPFMRIKSATCADSAAKVQNKRTIRTNKWTFMRFNCKGNCTGDCPYKGAMNRAPTLCGLEVRAPVALSCPLFPEDHVIADSDDSRRVYNCISAGARILSGITDLNFVVSNES